MKGRHVGYVRVSTHDQNTVRQLADCTVDFWKIYEEKASGAQRDRPQLMAALDVMRAGDTLVCYRMDRVARSLRQLIETVEDLEARGIGFKSLNE